MRLTISSLKSSKLILFAISLTTLASCATYQSTSDDGIYASKNKKTKVIVADSEEYNEYEDNYFTSQVGRLDRINGTDIFTDIDDYSSVNDEDELIIENDTLDYRPNSAWGTDSNTTVVVINNGIGNYSDFWWDWQWDNWRWNRWNRWNRWGLAGNWGWGFNNFGFYNAFYCPPFYNGFGFYGPYRGNRFFNNRFNRFNRRNGYLANNTRRYNTSRRGYVTNRRTTTSRRNSSNIRRNNTIRTRTRNNSVRSNNVRPRTRSTYTKPRARTRTRTRSTSPTRTRTRSSSTRTRSSSTRGRSRSSSTKSRGSSRRKRG